MPAYGIEASEGTLLKQGAACEPRLGLGKEVSRPIVWESPVAFRRAPRTALAPIGGDRVADRLPGAAGTDGTCRIAARRLTLTDTPAHIATPGPARARRRVGGDVPHHHGRHDENTVSSTTQTAKRTATRPPPMSPRGADLVDETTFSANC